LLIALRAVRAHWLRSTLTMLGLVIGVSAVILLAACGQGGKNSVDARIQPVANNITIVSKTAGVPNGPPPAPPHDPDADALQRAPDSATVTRGIAGSTGSTASPGTVVQTNTVQFLSANIIGTTDIWATTNNRTITAGSFFDQDRASSAARVVVLGPSVARV